MFSAQVVNGYSRLLNMDCEGNDIGAIKYAGEKKCKEMCDTTIGCVAFVIAEVKEGVKKRYKCHRKNQCTSSKAKNRFYTYIAGDCCYISAFVIATIYISMLLNTKVKSIEEVHLSKPVRRHIIGSDK